MFFPQPWSPANEIETQLLSSVSDDAACDVYADWLEERGEGDRAEFLRLHRQARAGSTDPRVLDRLAVLARWIDPVWRQHVMPVDRVVEEPLPEPQPATVQLSPPPPPRRLFSSVEARTTTAWVPSTRVPGWIRIGSTFAFSTLVLSFVLYWLL